MFLFYFISFYFIYFFFSSIFVFCCCRPPFFFWALSSNQGKKGREKEIKILSKTASLLGMVVAQKAPFSLRKKEPFFRDSFFFGRVGDTKRTIVIEKKKKRGKKKKKKKKLSKVKE